MHPGVAVVLVELEFVEIFVAGTGSQGEEAELSSFGDLVGHIGSLCGLLPILMAP